MRERGLELSQEKTVITHGEEVFDFLGQNVRKYHGTLLITPSHKNVRTFLDKGPEIIRKHKQATAGTLILQLNPVIRGWALYHGGVRPNRRNFRHAHGPRRVPWSGRYRRVHS